jgi:NAD-dependent deacetylase
MVQELRPHKEAADRLRQSRCAIALTGAGISVESGIPDFRSADGLWSRYDPMEFGHIVSFRRNPAKVWQMLLEMDALLHRSVPNPAHYALAELEQRRIIKSIITQNVDSLHQRAGSLRVVEYHGDGRTLRCDGCAQRYSRETVPLAKLPPLCWCGKPLRPNFVFFGEDIPPAAHRDAMEAARHCDLMLVVGTSGTVAPASYLPAMAKQGGAFILEINPAKTEFSAKLADLSIGESAGIALPAIVAVLDGLEV